MTDIIWNTPLEFKIVGNFLEIMNKKETFSLDEMVKGNPRNKYCFIPVSYCSDLWKENIKDDFTLNYGNVVPLKVKNNDGSETDCVYGDVELICEDLDNGGLVVSVNGASPALLIGDATQELKGIFIINKITGVVLAYCILTETVDVTEYLIFAYQGYILEINNNRRVIDIEPNIPDIPTPPEPVIASDVILTASNTNLVLGDSVDLTATVMGSNDLPYSDKTVTFKMGETVLGEVLTDDNGEAVFEYTPSSSGELTVSVVIEDVSDSIVLIVTELLPVPASISLSSDKSVIQTGETATISALVLDSGDNPVPNVEVSFSSDIPNSSEYTTITNTDGEAEYPFTPTDNVPTSITANIGDLESNTIELSVYFEIPLTGNIYKHGGNMPSVTSNGLCANSESVWGLSDSYFTTRHWRLTLDFYTSNNSRTGISLFEFKNGEYVYHKPLIRDVSNLMVMDNTDSGANVLVSGWNTVEFIRDGDMWKTIVNGHDYGFKEVKGIETEVFIGGRKWGGGNSCLKNIRLFNL